MTQVNRRSALSVGLAAMAAFVAAASAYAQRQLPPGISLQAWGKRESMIPGYKTVSMRDLVYQPGAKTSNPSMPNDMVCHVPEGELRVKQSDGMEFVAKKGDVWTCKKGIGEDLENVGSTVAIIRIVDLLPVIILKSNLLRQHDVTDWKFPFRAKAPSSRPCASFVEFVHVHLT